MTLQYHQGTQIWAADIEGPDQTVDARCSDDAASVFVPVVGQGFIRGKGSGLMTVRRKF